MCEKTATTTTTTTTNHCPVTYGTQSDQPDVNF